MQNYLFKVKNRTNDYHGTKYDIIIGPVANDNTMPVINAYISGMIDEETTLILLKPQKLSDQYVFSIHSGLKHLKLKEVKIYE